MTNPPGVNQPAPVSKRTCLCGHTEDVHAAWGTAWCTKCGCVRFQERVPNPDRELWDELDGLKDYSWLRQVQQYDFVEALLDAGPRRFPSWDAYEHWARQEMSRLKQAAKEGAK